MVLGQELSAVFSEIVEKVGHDGADTNGNDPNPLRNDLQRQCASQLSQGTLRRDVSGATGAKYDAYEAILTIAPVCFFLICLTASRDMRKAPVTFVSICQFQRRAFVEAVIETVFRGPERTGKA